MPLPDTPPNAHTHTHTLLLPAGQGRRARDKVLKYRHLSEAQKAKLLAALEGGEAVGERQRGELRTEVGCQGRQEVVGGCLRVIVRDKACFCVHLGVAG